VLGLNVHLRGKMWLYFVDAHHRLRADGFGFGNYTGALAALVFALLLGLSNDVSLRRLGVERWKSLQRWAYAGIVLTAAHAITYQRIEKRIAPFQVTLYIIFGIVFAFQMAGMIKSPLGLRTKWRKYNKDRPTLHNPQGPPC
jgi:methionine sulfoxide reductase heme-binding subunit